MPDVFADINSIPTEMVQQLADVLETRAAIPSQQEMTLTYLNEIDFPKHARVLEVGCGTGPVCRSIATILDVAEVVGIDQSELLLEKAAELSRGFGNITYLTGDATRLDFPDSSFDVVVLHTILTHVPDPAGVLSEVHRVLKPQGQLGLCDGDFSTATLRLCNLDPLEICCHAFVESSVTDKYFVRKMSSLVEDAGFSPKPLRSYGLVETLSPGLTLSWVSRGADALVRDGVISETFAEAMKAEGERRAQSGSFFGYMAYASLTAAKIPGR